MMITIPGQPTLPARVSIREVGPRDGLQNEDSILSTAQKLQLLDALAATGLSEIEAGAFVRPQNVPQMADTASVFRTMRRKPGIRYSAIAPNAVGAQHALAAEVDALQVFLSASESHNQSNVNMSIAASLAQVGDMAEVVRSAGKPFEAVLSVAFGCPYEGAVPVERVLELCAELFARGVEQITLGDTTGMGHPLLVQQIVFAFQRRFPQQRLRLHMHNARGAGLANILAALQLGVDEFDSSIGGVGGCPFAPGAPGNLCTEDLTHMLHEMGIATGLNLPLLIDAARLLEAMLGHEVPSQTLKAGICKHIA